jgi:hypothetical protein
MTSTTRHIRRINDATHRGQRESLVPPYSRGSVYLSHWCGGGRLGACLLLIVMLSFHPASPL